MKDEKKILAACAGLLLPWYREHRRNMPWRDDPSPYHVWLSEIMLQQTRIEAAAPYYERFLRELPAVEDLAACSDERLMKLWQGLGYYSRARNLKKAAQMIVERFGGKIPDEAPELRKLPGVGSYTAGAVASIAYGRPEPAVDGNVLRVLSRLLASEEDVLDPSVRRGAEDLLRAIYPAGRDAADLTQGWMELGEVVCIPNGAPNCAACPLGKLCEARKAGKENELPRRAPKKERRIEEKTVLIFSDGERIALGKRGEKGLLAGLWELPSLPGRLSEEEVRKKLTGEGIDFAEILPAGEATHLFTHVEWRMTGFFVRTSSPPAGCVFPEREALFRDYAVPSAFRRYLQWIRKNL